MVNRKVFSIMDLLSALGGLAGALVGVFTLGVVVFQHKAAVNYMANNTYLFKDTRDEKSKRRGFNHYNISFVESIRLSF